MIFGIFCLLFLHLLGEHINSLFLKVPLFDMVFSILWENEKQLERTVFGDPEQ